MARIASKKTKVMYLQNIYIYIHHRIFWLKGKKNSFHIDLNVCNAAV